MKSAAALSGALALAFVALLATSAGAVTRKAKPKAEKPTTVCGTVRVDHVQCIRAPCPPLVFLTPDGSKKQYSISHDAGQDEAKAGATLHHGAHVCVTGHLAGARMDNLTVVKASKKP